MEPYRLDGVDAQEDAEYPTQLPCVHILGSICVNLWTTMSNTCPFCRTELFKLDSVSQTPLWHDNGRSDSHDTWNDSYVSHQHVHADDLEPISNWERAWYDAMGIEHSSSDNYYYRRELPDNSSVHWQAHVRPAYTASSVARHNTRRGEQAQVSATRVWNQVVDPQAIARDNALPAPRHNGSSTQYIQRLNVWFRSKAQSAMRRIFGKPRTAETMLAEVMSPRIAQTAPSWVIPPEAETEINPESGLDFADSDAQMRDLIECHEQWMAEFACQFLEHREELISAL